MPLGPSKLLISNQGVGGDSPDYVNGLDGNSVILEAWPVQTGVATVTLIDSADETTGYYPGVSPAAVQPGLTGRTKVQIDNVLQFMKVRIAISSGMWNVRVTPINSSGATSIAASISGTVGQGAPASDSSLGWFVRVSDGWGVMPNAAGNMYALYARAAATGTSVSYRAQATSGLVTVTLNPIAGKDWVLGGVAWGITDVPPAGTLLEVRAGASIMHRLPITAAGPGELLWPEERYGPNTGVVVELLGLTGSGLTGYVEALGARSDTWGM